MSVAGGTFGTDRRIRGGSHSSVPSQYLIGFWPMQQADGDADDEQITDRSPNEAHASIGSLTSTEAWDTAGYFHALAEADHFGTVPLAKWPVRYTEGSLLMVGWTKCVKDTGAKWIWGNGTSDSITGGGLFVTTSGTLTFNLRGTGSVSSNSSPSGVTTYATDSLHQWIVGIDYFEKSVSLGADGVISLAGNTTIPAASFAAADGAVTSGIAIGGRAGVGSGISLFANASKLWQAYYFPGKGLPSNLALLCDRLYHHPRMWLRDQDIEFA